MNKFKYIFLLMAGALVVASCSDSSTLADKIAETPNIAGFTAGAATVSHISDGTEYAVDLPMKVFGPSVRQMSGDVTVTLEVVDYSDSNPTTVEAQAGVHYRIDTNTLMLKESDDYIGNFTFTMLTAGITAPLDQTPRLKIKATAVDGAGNVVASGKPIEVTLNYACPSNLQGMYVVTTTGWNGTYTNTVAEEVIKLSVGTYMTQSVSYFFPGGYRGAYLANGVRFTDVCGTVDVANMGVLGGTYSNDVFSGATTTPVGNPQVPGGVSSFTLKYSVDGLDGFTSVYNYVGPLPNTSSDKAAFRIPMKINQETLPVAEKL